MRNLKWALSLALASVMLLGMMVVGTSATTFSGNQPLTAVQAALMMLRALGYEHLTKNATDWRAPVTAQANKIGLFKGVVSSPSAQLTRNQVVQLALNALESDVVDFTGELGWEINGVTVGFQAKWELRRDLNNVSNNGYNYTNDSGTTHQKEYLQLLEDLYDGKLTKNTHAYDDFDRPATKWTYKGKVLEKTATSVLTRWTGINTGDSANSFTAGNTYKYSKQAYINVDGTPGTIAGFTVDKSELDVYCDDYGYAIYVSGVEGTKNYAVVIGKGETNPYGDQTTGVTLLLADGPRKTVTAKWKTADNSSTIKLTNGSSENLPYTSNGKNLVNDMLGNVVTYKINKDGTYDLTMGGLNAGKTAATGKWDAANYTADGDVTFVNGRSLLTLNCTTGTNASDPAYDKTIYTTEKTVFFVVTKNSKNEAVYNVYTGYSNMSFLRTGSGTAIKGIGYVMNSDYTTQGSAVFIAVDSVKGLSASQTFVVKQKNHEVVKDNTGSYGWYDRC